MSTNKFLTKNSGGKDTLTTAIATSGGAGDANKIVATGSNGKLDTSLVPSTGVIAHREFGNLQAVASGSADVTVVDFTLPTLQIGDTIHITMHAQGGGTMSASGGVWLRWVRDGVTGQDLYTLFNATINTVGIQRYVKVRDTDFWLAVLGDTNFGSNATAPLTAAINRALTQKIQVVFRSQNLTTTLHNLTITVWRDAP